MEEKTKKAPFSKGVPSADGGGLPGLMSESPGPAGPPPLKRGQGRGENPQLLIVIFPHKTR